MTRLLSTTPAGSPSSPRSPVSPRTRSSSSASPHCSTSTIVGPPVPSQTPETARASCSRCRIASSVGRRASISRPRGSTPWGSRSCRAMRSPRRPRARTSSASQRWRACAFSDGETCRPIRRRWAAPPSVSCRTSSSFLSRRSATPSPACRWSAWPSACASARSTRPMHTSRPCRAARWSTRACSRRISLARSSRTCPIRMWSQRSPWCIRASAPIPSPRGR